MTDSLEIQPRGRFEASIRPPGSKSITNRALICAALADGRSTLTGALDSEDTQVMIAALRQLGLMVEVDLDAATIALTGCGGCFTTPAPLKLYIANSGTTVRFLAAMLTLGRGEFELNGTSRMQERPIQDLIDALKQLGGVVESITGSGCPPIRIKADGLPGRAATVRGDISSQYLSALLMAAPCAQQAVELKIDGTLVSQPYVRMTLEVMRSFGATIETDDDLQRFTIPQASYQPREYAVEPDASAASYFFGAAAVTGGTVTVQGLSRRSLQGDVTFVEVLEKMGCRAQWQEDSIRLTGGKLHGVEVDMNAISDTVQTLAPVALFAEGPTTVTGIGHIRHKETDRIAALATELRKLGAEVDQWDDGLRITPGPLRSAAIDTYDDHRMAMSLALAGLGLPGVVINDPGCVNKTYPHFFRDLDSLWRE